MLEQGIVLSSQRGVNSISIAEHALSLMLALIQGVDIHIRRQDKEIWGRFFTDRVKDPHIDWELDGRTLLIAGLGTIGTEIARRANALGMRVIATRNSSRNGGPISSTMSVSPTNLTNLRHKPMSFSRSFR